MIAHDPSPVRTSGFTASGSHLGCKRPSAREDRDEKREPMETGVCTFLCQRFDAALASGSA